MTAAPEPCDWPSPEQLELDLAAAEQAAADERAHRDLHRLPPEPPAIEWINPPEEYL
ncbi:hypothetical protein [Streptomyces sp. NPDC047097]|uniref:hypothetical protein n=1 Tax=Streptomyces sp. NPDC047097 TaxID=3155260 RepID=UPI0033DEFA9E